MKQTKVSEARKLKTEENLATKGHNISVLWDSVYQTDRYKQLVNVKCNVCDNISETMLSNLSNGHYLCNSCNVIKYKNFIKDSNWEYVSHGAGRVKLECSVCGNTISTKSSIITRGNTPICTVCRTNSYIAACEKLNLMFKGVVNTGDHTCISTECTLCGEKRDIHSGDVLHGRFRCSGCLRFRYKSALAERCCTFIGIEKKLGKSSYVHYSNENGDKFKASGSNVLSGRFEVSVDGYWSHPHSTYLVKMDIDENNSICKIGTANNPERRIKSLKLNKPYTVYTLEQFGSRFEADKLESELHNEFSDARLHPDCTKHYTEVIRSRKYSDGKYHRVKDGITEWFSSEVFDILSKRYNLE